MADYIERGDAFDAVMGQFCACSDETEAALNGAIEYIRKITAADVRPVVLCADCKHKGWIQEPEHGKSVDYCRLLDRCVDEQFFCAAGERNCGAMMGGEG